MKKWIRVLDSPPVSISVCIIVSIIFRPEMSLKHFQAIIIASCCSKLQCTYVVCNSSFGYQLLIHRFEAQLKEWLNSPSVSSLSPASDQTPPASPDSLVPQTTSLSKRLEKLQTEIRAAKLVMKQML